MQRNCLEMDGSHVVNSPELILRVQVGSANSRADVNISSAWVCEKMSFPTELNSFHISANSSMRFRLRGALARSSLYCKKSGILMKGATTPATWTRSPANRRRALPFSSPDAILCRPGCLEPRWLRTAVTINPSLTRLLGV